MSLNNLYIGIDPGLTTGAAVWDGKTLEAFEWDIDKVFGFIPLLSKGDVVVCETFTLRPGISKQSRQYEALWIIGALKYAASAQKFDLVFQSPAEAKGFRDRKGLKELGLSADSLKGSHRLDACRHLMLYLMKAKLWNV